MKPLNQHANIHDDIVNFYYAGTEKCVPAHSYGPAIRDHYLFHYIHSGTGEFRIDQKSYHLRAGQGFLTCPKKVIYYIADDKDPWDYTHIGFKGDLVAYYLGLAGLNAAHPIITFKDTYAIESTLREIIDMATQPENTSHHVRLLGLTYTFLSHLINENQDHIHQRVSSKYSSYINKAIDYITLHYKHKISVKELADYIGIDRKYMSRLFMKELGVSPREFILNFKIRKACELLQDNTKNISQVSSEIGYDDPSVFSKAFKKIMNVPPSMYRNKNV